MQISTIVQTIGFQELSGKEGYSQIIAPFVSAVLQLMRSSQYWEADFFIGDPKAKKITFEDNDRTCRIPFLGGREQIYVKIDGGDKTPSEWKDAGYPEYPIMTLMLSTEY